MDKNKLLQAIMEARGLLNKRAFQPAPMDPAMTGGVPPQGMPMDPAMAGGVPPQGMPMDPAMAGGVPPQGMPMDPSMAGGMPPQGMPMDPSMAGGMPPQGMPMDPAMASDVPPQDPSGESNPFAEIANILDQFDMRISQQEKLISDFRDELSNLKDDLVKKDSEMSERIAVLDQYLKDIKGLLKGDFTPDNIPQDQR